MYVLCIAGFLQAPLTNSDTAVLSGSLSTHNGNGGGNISMTIRRVTSARGWGEVNAHPDVWCTKTDGIEVFCRDCCGLYYTYALRYQTYCVLLFSKGGIWCRRHTWTSRWVKNVSQCDSTEVRPGIAARCISTWTLLSVVPFFIVSVVRFFPQFLNSPGWFAVLSSRFAAELLSDDSAPPGPKHHGLSAVALGPQQCHDYQSGPGHKAHSLYSCFAGT